MLRNMASFPISITIYTYICTYRITPTYFICKSNCILIIFIELYSSNGRFPLISFTSVFIIIYHSKPKALDCTENHFIFIVHSLGTLQYKSLKEDCIQLQCILYHTLNGQLAFFYSHSTAHIAHICIYYSQVINIINKMYCHNRSENNLFMNEKQSGILYIKMKGYTFHRED